MYPGENIAPGYAITICRLQLLLDHHLAIQMTDKSHLADPYGRSQGLVCQKRNLHRLEL